MFRRPATIWKRTALLTPWAVAFIVFCGGKAGALSGGGSSEEAVSSSPIGLLFLSLVAIAVTLFMIWVVARNFASDEPFPLDIPVVDPSAPLTRWQQLIRAIRCTIYGLIWLVLLFAVFDIPITIMQNAGALDSMPDWIGFTLFGVLFCIWIAILRFKVSLRWPLTIIGLLVVPVGGFVMSVIGATGLGKLIIMSNGRWNVFAGSKMKSGKLRAKPRGLVEVPDND